MILLREFIFILFFYFFIFTDNLKGFFCHMTNIKRQYVSGKVNDELENLQI